MLEILFKALVLVVLAILIRGTLPRYRVDQLIYQNWKISIFVYLSFFLNVLILISLFS